MTQPPGIGAEELPPELTDLMEEMRAAKLAKVESLGKEVARKRDEAIKARKMSHIEQLWQEDLEYYHGVDEANREYTPWIKSPSTSGGISRKQVATATRSTAFFNITRQFCDSAAARMGDILLPAGDHSFLIKPTPVPQDQEQAAAEMSADNLVGTQAATDQQPGQSAAPFPPQGGPPADVPSPDIQAKAEKAEKVIEDWLVECHYHTEARRAIEMAAIIGVGILKGPVPAKRKSIKSADVPDGMALEIVQKIAPVSKAVDPQDFFPDPCCGENIQDGSYVLERDRLSPRRLKELKGVPGYLSEQIDKVLEEGVGKKNTTEQGFRLNQEQLHDDDAYEVWYYYGHIDVGCLSAMGVKVGAHESHKNTLPAVVTLVNDTPIRAFLNPLDSGEFPYDVMCWQRMHGYWAGIGVARQMRTAQNMLNASARAMMDNAGLSSAPQLIIRQNAIVPADGRWEITARKVWWATEQADVRSVSDAIQAINIPMIQPELMAIVELAKKMAEEATGMFFLLQGQQGAAPDTVGGLELLNRNASTVLRRLARTFDECITEPHIRRYYEWLLMYGPEDCKGDMQIEAVGSTAMVEREIQAIQAMQILNLSIQPAYGLDPAKAMQETLKSLRLIPEKWVLSEEQKRQAAQQQPTIPAIEIAKMKSADLDKQLQFDKWKATVDARLKQHRTETDLDRDTLYADTMARRDQTTREIRIEEMRLKREMSLLDYANRHQLSLEQIKAKLADSAMKLRVQKELARASSTAKQVATPPTEPPQHAPDGRAFQE